MSRLAVIQETVQQVAEAITDVIGVETEIVDASLVIVAGSGRYKEKIGRLEEAGDLNSELLYARALRTGESYIIADAESYPGYGAMENELAEVCCSIKLGGAIIGLMGLVAFDGKQKELLLSSTNNLMIFLNRMAQLIASGVAAAEVRGELAAVIDSIREGILAVDTAGIIKSCNCAAEQLTGSLQEKLVGRDIRELWKDELITSAAVSGTEQSDIEVSQADRHFLVNISPIKSKAFGLPGSEDAHIGSVLIFRDIAEVHKMIYDISEKKQVSSFDEIIGESRMLHEIKKKAAMIARSSSTVLITGESGTGKDLFARAIHFSSPRSKQPFIAVNCGAIPDTLLESELFGYEAGAFTGAKRTGKAGKFELANKGTIFLDEIGDMPLHLQVKLLHVLQRKEIERVGGGRVIPVDVRVIAATNRNLEEMMQEGEFREDLYFRLNVIPLHIPPLRERHGDVELLMRHALMKYNKIIGKEILRFGEESLQVLRNYDWPGNVRELENIVEYAVNVESNDIIDVDSLPPRIIRASRREKSSLSLSEQIATLEKRVIFECLEQTGWNVEGKIAAAKKLGISESTLYRRIRELDIVEKRHNRK